MGAKYMCTYILLKKFSKSSGGICPQLIEGGFVHANIIDDLRGFYPIFVKIYDVIYKFIFFIINYN